MSKPTILITGAAGFLGNILIKKLMDAKFKYRALTFAGVSNRDSVLYELDYDKVIALDNLHYRQVCLTDYCYRGDFEFVHGDVCDTDLLGKLVKRADIIIPLAAIVGMPACEQYKDLAYKVNYEQINFILSNMSKDQMLIFTMTNSGYGSTDGSSFCDENSPLTPVSWYGVTKCKAEQAILDSGNGIALRLATVFGVSPRMRLDLLVNLFTYNAVTDGYVVLYEPHFKRNYISIHDVALTILYMISNYTKYNNNVFNVGLSSANLSKLELCNKIKEHVPKFVIHVDEYSQDPDKRNYVVSNAKLESTGWKPWYTLDDGIQELIKAYNIIKHHRNRDFTNL